MLLEARGISFAYEGGPLLFEDISFSVEKGEIVCILGPNGVGKTTLLNCLANLAVPTGGKVLLEGNAMREMPLREIAARVAYVPQFIIPSFAYEVLSYVVTGCAPRLRTFEKPKREHYELARQALAQMEISHLAEKYYTQISGGERQQVSISRALTQRPKIILMDEPTAHLDYGNQIKVLRIIKKLAAEGYAAVITTHNPDHALLLEGKVAALGPGGQFTFGDSRTVVSSEFLSALYGVELHLHHIPAIGRDVCIAPFL